MPMLLDLRRYHDLATDIITCKKTFDPFLSHNFVKLSTGTCSHAPHMFSPSSLSLQPE